MSDYLADLIAVFKKHAKVDVVSGLSPTMFSNHFGVAFTCYVRNGESVTPEFGISIYEMMLLERFCRRLQPKSIFIIGNGFGWSTLGLAMMNPGASVVVVEPYVAIDETNRIAFLEKLSCMVVRGFSPDDNARIVGEYCPAIPDLVFIDGLHTSEQIVKDFNAMYALCGREAVYVFHDVVLHHMLDGLAHIARIARTHGMATDLLMATPSGMAIVYRDELPEDIKAIVSIFRPTTQGLEAVARMTGTPVPRHSFD
jgi:predicted O-methyltransferase YrrM